MEYKPPKLTDLQALEIFPEARSILLKRYKKELDFYKYLINFYENEKQRIEQEKEKAFASEAWAWDYCLSSIQLSIQRAEKDFISVSYKKKIAEGKNSSDAKLDITDYNIQIAKQTPIQSLLDVPFRKVGQRIYCRCPFHNERTPSFTIFTDKNRWHCFGQCNMGGDSIDFVMKRDGLSFVEAVKLLTKLE